MKQELKDLLLILTDKEKYKKEIYERYKDVLNSFDDLLGDNNEDMSILFYLVNRHYLHWLDADVDKAISEKEILFRRKFYSILKKVGPKMLGCTQVIENRNYVNNPSSNKADSPVVLPKEPVIFASNHGFRDDVLATTLAAGRHGYIYWGSLPQFYNTFDGTAASLVGEIMINRKNKNSKNLSIKKVDKVMKYGTDLIIFPEGGWNKTSEVLTNKLWKGVYNFSVNQNCKVVPIVHYVRDMEIVDKKNIIHTIIDDPIPLYEMSEKEALIYLRDVLCSWQYKMAEIYGKTTREEELKGYINSDQKWDDCVKKRMVGVARYDSELEKKSDYRPKEIILPEDVFEPITKIKNITAENIKMIEDAKKLVKERKKIDFQRNY